MVLIDNIARVNFKYEENKMNRERELLKQALDLIIELGEEAFVNVNDEDVVLKIKEKLEKTEQLTPSEWWNAAPWQPMETAPKDGTDILVRDWNWFITSCVWSDRFGTWVWGIREFNYPIAWLPLPEQK